MKKIFTLCVVAMMAVSMSARTYKHSVGMVAGLGIGAQYKTMVMENFTILAELGYFMNLDGGYNSKLGYSPSYGGGLANGVFAYQANIVESDGIRLDYYAGGQIKAGVSRGNAGIIGVGVAGGIEANMHNAPIAFSFDFRPGWAGVFGSVMGTSYSYHMFDYSFNLGVRYTF